MPVAGARMGKNCPAKPPNYGLHELVGDKAGQWAMTVAKNWRLSLTKIDDIAIAILNL
jgi:proteic killer suppression protein